MNFLKIFFPLVIIFIIISSENVFSVPAFPNAEGFGAETIGGRGGTVIKVLNLNDSGPGSFRAACEASGPRIVVFDVSGIINLTNGIIISNPNITIAGQTSPGGILIAGRMVLVNTHEVIIQHMRFRVGSHQIANGADSETLDSFGIWGEHWGANQAYNVIIDHCSMSWGVDETFSVSGGVTNLTVQWCIISEGLSNAGHPKGEHSKGFMVSGKYQYDSSVSVHHNYIAHNVDRSPLIYSPQDDYNNITTVDFVNNVSYDWKGGLSPFGEEIPQINWVYNYAKQGVNSHDFSYEVTHYAKEWSVTPRPLLYVHGNIGSTRLSQSEPHWNVGWYYTSEPCPTTWRRDIPWPTPEITTTEMSYTYAQEILTTVGAIAPVRDSVDTRVIADFIAGTGTFKDNVTYPDDYPVFATPAPQADSDNDGMADSWETANGLIVGSNDSALDKDEDGYTNIEEYLHDLSLIEIPNPSTIGTPQQLRIEEN